MPEKPIIEQGSRMTEKPVAITKLGALDLVTTWNPLI